METQAVDWLIDAADQEQQGHQEEGPAVTGEVKIHMPPDAAVGGAPTTVVRQLRVGENRVGKSLYAAVRVLVCGTGWLDRLTDGWLGRSIG